MTTITPTTSQLTPLQILPTTKIKTHNMPNRYKL